jgi:lambda repressor-like predicted transcriptional regulator
MPTPSPRGPRPLRPPARPALAAALAVAGMSQRSLARAAGVCPDSVYRWLRGDVAPNRWTQVLVAEALGVEDPAALFAVIDVTADDAVIALAAS